jgi:hypothetical protein
LIGTVAIASVNPQSPAEWLALAVQHEEAARVLAENRVAAGQSYSHVGFAVEAALKAYVMRKERLNGWPDKELRSDLYTHDLRKLVAVAQIELKPRNPIGPSWAVVLQWDRAQGYDPEPMPRRVARSMVEAAFGEKGVVTWIRRTLV